MFIFAVQKNNAMQEIVHPLSERQEKVVNKLNELGIPLTFISIHLFSPLKKPLNIGKNSTPHIAKICFSETTKATGIILLFSIACNNLPYTIWNTD